MCNNYNLASEIAIHQTCGFCRYWDIKHGVSIPSEKNLNIMYAPCKRDYENRLSSANHCEKPSLSQDRLVFRTDDACCPHEFGFRVSLSHLRSFPGLLKRMRDAVRRKMADQEKEAA